MYRFHEARATYTCEIRSYAKPSGLWHCFSPSLTAVEPAVFPNAMQLYYALAQPRQFSPAKTGFTATNVITQQRTVCDIHPSAGMQLECEGIPALGHIYIAYCPNCSVITNTYCTCTYSKNWLRVKAYTKPTLCTITAGHRSSKCLTLQKLHKHLNQQAAWSSGVGAFAYIASQR